MRGTHQDHRARATRGVAFAALTLLLPFTLYALFHGWYVFALGGTYINVLLVINTWLVAIGRDHEPVTLFGLVPGGTLFMGISFAVEGGIASAWCFPSVLACYCMLSGRRARLSNAIILAVALPMAWRTFGAIDAVPFMASLLAVSLFASILVCEIDAQQRQLCFGEAGAAFRIGGEEFLVLLAAHDANAARRVAERVRRAIAGEDMLAGHPVTASIGAAALGAGDDRQGWMRRADERLYAAKRGGRDRVVSGGPAARAQACRPAKPLPLPAHD